MVQTKLTDYLYVLKGRSGVLSCRLPRSGLTENGTSLRYLQVVRNDVSRMRKW